jgi:hypothetical protein
MGWLFGSEPLLYPALGPAVVAVIRVAYGVLLLATLASVMPLARRYFLSERWGGYAERGWRTDPVQNPVVMPVVLALWLAAAVALVGGRLVVAAAVLNLVFCHYFFIQMRWRGVLRGMGAPGFIAYWLGAAVLLIELTTRHAPAVGGLALLVLQVDFALIMLSAGAYKFSAGYPQNHGMELGMVNPEWGYWWRSWSRRPPASVPFRVLNQLAWSIEVGAALLMLYPPTRFAGGMLILASFVFIATQIRLGFLCEMVIVCCLLFAHPGSFIDRWLTSAAGAGVAPLAADRMPWLEQGLAAGLWAYLMLLPLVRAGLEYNLRARRPLLAPLQRALEGYTNAFGMIIWRVFSADVTNFCIRLVEERADGSRHVLSRWGKGLRYRQVAEAITVTTLFTTLKYYPSNNALFVSRLLRYARTVPISADSTLLFEYQAVMKRPDRFELVPVAEFRVDPGATTVSERTLDHSFSLRAPAARSPIHEGVRPGSYVPVGR